MLMLRQSAIGLQIGVGAAFGYLAGAWLDGKLGTQPWLAFFLLLCGVTSGFIDLVRVARQAQRAEEEEGR